MGLLNKIVFAGIDSSDYGIYISGDGAFNAPVRRGELVSVPGRNGDIFFDEGTYENIEIEYPALCPGVTEKQFKDRLTSFRSAIVSRQGYQRLEDTYHDDEFRLAIYKDGLEVEPKNVTRAGEFTLTFNCKPQRFLKSGEDMILITQSRTLTNPTKFESMPIIKVRGNGYVNFTGVETSYSFMVSDNDDQIIIETEDAFSYYLGGDLYYLEDSNEEYIWDTLWRPIEVANGRDYVINAGSRITFTDHIVPKLPAGQFNVGISSDIISLEIIPRWWRL